MKLKCETVLFLHRITNYIGTHSYPIVSQIVCVGSLISDHVTLPGELSHFHTNVFLSTCICKLIINFMTRQKENFFEDIKWFELRIHM